MTKERAAKIILDMINGAESTFGHSLSTLEINALKKGYCALDPEPITNADRIRAMSNEELAIWFSSTSDRNCPNGGSWNCQESCKQCWLAWLRKEVTE